MNKRIALITGITGQDGSYLAELLLEKGYTVHGLVRRSSSFNTYRIEKIFNNKNLFGKNFFTHYSDLTDSANLCKLILKIKPTEVYNLAAQSHVKVSFEMPEYTANVDGLGVLRLLEAIRMSEINCRFYQASTSELYGQVVEVPQSEKTPFYPRSPYGVAKLYAFWICKNYREAYGMHISNGILFNHESPRRGPTFVTRKITRAVARIHKGLQDKLYLGNLDAKRDWGHAKEYCEAMWLMLQEDKPDDYVVATGKTHTVRKFVELAFSNIGIEILWKGEGINEKGYDKNNESKILIEINPKYFRPTEVELLIGDPKKAKEILGWESKIKLETLVKEMVESDVKLVESGDLFN